MNLKKKLIIGTLSVVSLGTQADGPKIIIHEEPKYISPYDSKSNISETVKSKTPEIIFNTTLPKTAQSIQMAPIPQIYTPSPVVEIKSEPKTAVKIEAKKVEPVKTPVKTVAKPATPPAKPIIKPATPVKTEVKPASTDTVVKAEVKPASKDTIVKEEVKPVSTETVVKEEVKPSASTPVLASKSFSTESVKSDDITIQATMLDSSVANSFSDSLKLYMLENNELLSSMAKYMAYLVGSIISLLLTYMIGRFFMKRVKCIPFRKEPEYNDLWFRPKD